MIDLIKSCPLFHELYDKEVEKIIARCLVASYGAGDMIIREGEDGHDFFVVLSGSCIVTREIDDKRVVISKIQRGEVFGETVLINETRRSANVEADEPCDILIITHEAIFSLYKKSPKIFALLILNLARMLTKRLRSTNETISKMHETFKKAS